MYALIRLQFNQKTGNVLILSLFNIELNKGKNYEVY